MIYDLWGKISGKSLKYKNQDNGEGNSFIQNINQGEMCEGAGSCYIVWLGPERMVWAHWREARG